jgi:hypothetical protein
LVAHGGWIRSIDQLLAHCTVAGRMDGWMMRVSSKNFDLIDHLVPADYIEPRARVFL